MCVSFPSSGKFSVTVTSNKFSALTLSSPFGTHMLIMLQVVQEVSYTHFLKFFFLFAVQLGDFHYSVFLSLIHSSVSSNLPLIPSNVFLICYCILQIFLYIFKLSVKLFTGFIHPPEFVEHLYDHYLELFNE